MTGCDVVETEVGPVCITSDGASICEVVLGRRRKRRPDAVTRVAAHQLKEYFAGKRTDFDFPIRLDTRGFTDRVLRQLARIPYGETLSYGEVAGAVGNPRAARAVGQAVGSNPLPIVFPCHRVLAADGIGGFGSGLRWKRFLLRLERPTSRA